MGHGEVVSSTSTMGGVTRGFGFQYDAAGNRTRVTHPDGTWFAYGYDALGRATGVTQSNGVTAATHGYDGAGRLSSLGKLDGGSTGWSYDGIGRVTGETIAHGNGVSYGLTYNPASQVTGETRSNAAYVWTGAVAVDRGYGVNGLNQYTSAGSTGFGYDANGNLTQSGSTTYGYDIENRLVSVSGGMTLDYDSLGRLWRVSTPSGTTQFAYDGDALAVEYDAGGQVLRRYVHDTGADTPLIWYEGSGLGSAQTLP